MWPLKTGFTVVCIALFYFSGTDEERGIKKWRKLDASASTSQSEALKIYELPLIQKYLNRWKICEYLPFCPTFSFGSNKKSGEMREKSLRDKNSSSQERMNTFSDFQENKTNTHL